MFRDLHPLLTPHQKSNLPTYYFTTFAKKMKRNFAARCNARQFGYTQSDLDLDPDLT